MNLKPRQTIEIPGENAIMQEGATFDVSGHYPCAQSEYELIFTVNGEENNSISVHEGEEVPFTFSWHAHPAGDYNLTVELFKSGYAGAFDSVDVIVIETTTVGVERISVDASNPTHTLVHYRTHPIEGVIDQVKFTALGTSQIKNDVSGDERQLLFPVMLMYLTHPGLDFMGKLCLMTTLYRDSAPHKLISTPEISKKFPLGESCQ